MRISKLQPSQHVKGRWLAFLEDNSILRLGENEVVSFGLYAGMELDGVTLEALAAAAKRAAVREKALDLIAARPLSRKELLERLTARPRDREKPPLTDREGAQAAADWLEELGYLDDAEYARTLVRHYSAKGYGARKLRDELYRRGVPREYWDEALEEAEAPDEAIDALLRKKLAGWTGDRKELKRATDALARKGYRWDEISAGVRRFGAEPEE